MNERSDMDRVLSQWFEDGPSTMPDRVVDVVADRIARQRQRPAWRLQWRPFDMNASIKIAAAIAVVVVLAIVGWNLLPDRSTGVGVGPAPTPTPTPSLASTPTPAPTRPWWAGTETRPCGLPVSCAGELSAGRQTSRSIRPSFTFTVPTGWVNTADWHDLDDYFALAPDTPANRAAAARDEDFAQSMVIGPHRTVVGADCESRLDGAGLSAAEVVGALATREGLATSEPETVTISGLTGRQIDVGLEPGWTGTCPQDPTTAAVALLGGTPAQGENRQRIVILDTPDCGESVEQGPICASGGNISIVIYADRAADFDAFLSDAMPIVESFEFDIGAGASPSPS